MMGGIMSVDELWNCSTIYVIYDTFTNFRNVWLIHLKSCLSCIPITHPEMKDHISHMTRKTEVMLQHNDMTPFLRLRRIEKGKVNGICLW
jgi:hypothetical protein